MVCIIWQRFHFLCNYTIILFVNHCIIQILSIYKFSLINEQMHETNRNAKPLLNSCPTRSLREYLAYQSVQNSQQEEERKGFRFEVELDAGDGRSELIVIDEATDIQRQAQDFCRRHDLDSHVEDILAQTIREQYESQAEQSYHSTVSKQIESLTEVYGNIHAREVLLSENNSVNSRTIQNTTKQRESQQKGADRILRNHHKNKKYSLGENYLMENKENQPEINRISQEICDKLGKENIIEQRNRRSKEKHAALLREKHQKQEEMMKQCAFRPKINAISKQVDREIAESSLSNFREERKCQRFKRLYNDHWQLQQKKEEERQNYLMEMPFKPTINQISRKIMESKKSTPNLESQEKHEKKPHLGCSNATNTSLPHTGRGPKNRNIGQLPIGEYLYSQAMKKSKPKVQEQRAEVKALEHSDYLVAHMKEKRINQIFTELTSPPHQELTCLDINLSLPPFKAGKFKPFTPIFNEMIEMDVSLTRPEFLDAALQLFKLFSPQEKHSIVFRKDKQTDPNLSRSKSKSNMKRAQHQGGIYDRGLQHLRYVQEKNERNREDRVRAELRYCTFKPQVHHLQ